MQVHIAYAVSERTQGEDIACEVCGDAADGASMLLCDGCDLGFHMRCLSPPLAAVPAGSWHCCACVGNNGKDGTKGRPDPSQAFTQA